MSERSQTYEKAVKVKNNSSQKAKKATALLLYAGFFAFFLLFAIDNVKLLVPIVALGVLLTFILVRWSWKYLNVEYEYSFWYGAVSVAKIYGNKKRRALIDTDMKDLLMVAPANEEYAKKAEHFGIGKRIDATSGDPDQDVWLMVAGREDEDRTLVFFEADQRALSLLREANPYVFIKAK